MTQLHIERKERTAWPWVLLGLLLVALLLWFVFGRASDGAEVADRTPPVLTDSVPAAAAAGATMPAELSEFVQFVESRSSADAGVAHDYTAEGLRRLAGALGAVATGASVSGVDVEQRLTGIRERADAMQRDSTSTQHALQAREAALLAGGLLQQMQAARAGTAESAPGPVNEAARAISAERPLLEQVSEVQRFFEQAASALRALGTQG